MTLAGLHVLLIEDDPDAREALQALLELDGHRIDTAEDGPRGIEAARKTAHDVVLVDIGLPGLDGYEVGRQIRAHGVNPRTFLIALTGYGQPEDRKRSAAAGFDTHLVKPVDPSDLTRLLEELAGRDRAPRDDG